MKIEVLVNFGGVETGEKRILPGIYAADAPALCGKQAIDFMLSTGKARVIEPDVAPVADSTPNPSDDPPDYSSYTRAGLKDLLDKAGIDYGKRDNRDTLIALLTGDDS